MSAPLETVDTVCTLIFSGQRLLLVYNDNWGKFTLPMTKLRHWDVGLSRDSLRRELGEEAALRNVAECLWLATDRLPNLLMDFGDLKQSDRSKETNHYAFQLFGFEVAKPEAGPVVISEWLTADEIVDSKRRLVSPTARSLISALREAALSREGRFPPVDPATPRTSVSSIAIIDHEDRGEKKWLCQWNQRWGRYFLVGGHQHDGEDARQCLIRELEEELQITGDVDYRLQPRRSLQYADWSTSAWQTTNYDVSTFDVRLTADAIAKIKKDPANRWVAAREIRSDRCADDKLISPTARRLLATLGDLPGAMVEWKLAGEG